MSDEAKFWESKVKTKSELYKRQYWIRIKLQEPLCWNSNSVTASFLSRYKQSVRPPVDDLSLAALPRKTLFDLIRKLWQTFKFVASINDIPDHAWPADRKTAAKRIWIAVVQTADNCTNWETLLVMPLNFLQIKRFQESVTGTLDTAPRSSLPEGLNNWHGGAVAARSEVLADCKDVQRAGKNRQFHKKR
jgi:hypothetical protein